MNMESNAEEHEVQEVAAGDPSCDIQGLGVLEALAADKVNNPALPEQRGIETANNKVSKHTLTLPRVPRALSFTFCRHPELTATHASVRRPGEPVSPPYSPVDRSAPTARSNSILM